MGDRCSGGAETPATPSSGVYDPSVPSGYRGTAGGGNGAQSVESGTGKRPSPFAGPPDGVRVLPADPKVSGHPVSLTVTSGGDKRDTGGRPTTVALAAKDRTQTRLAFGTSGASAVLTPADAVAGMRPGLLTRGTGLAPPPTLPARPKSAIKAKASARARDLPEGSGAVPESALAAAIRTVKEGRGESLTKKDLLALLVGLLESGYTQTPTANVLEGAAAGGRGEGRPSKRGRTDATDGVALFQGDVDASVLPPYVPPMPVPVDDPMGSETHVQKVRGADAHHAHPPCPAADATAALEERYINPVWDDAPPKQPRAKGIAEKARKGPEVSPPRATDAPTPTKRVPVKVSPPRAKAKEGETPSPMTKVVFDGVPMGTTHLGFSRILEKFNLECSSTPGSTYPESPVTASVHLLGQGGWVVSYADADTATLVLGQDPAVFAAAVGVEPSAVDIHRPGAATKRGLRVAAVSSRSIYLHLEPTILGEIWGKVAATLPGIVAKGPERAPSAGHKAPTHTPGIPSLPAHRELLQDALRDIFVPPEGEAFEKVQVLGKTGAIIIVMMTPEGAAKAISEGILARSLARRMVVRMAHSPDQRGGRAFCTRCLGIGHRPHQCGEKSRCRVCGEAGHCAALGVCPKQHRHPAHPKGEALFCVSCGVVGHRAGAATCAELLRAKQGLAKGADGSYVGSVAAARTARVDAAKVTAKGVSAAPGMGAWATPLRGVAAPGTGPSVRPGVDVQASLKIDRLERALHDMQEQLSMLVKVMMASQKPAAVAADDAAREAEEDREIAHSLAMQD